MKESSSLPIVFKEMWKMLRPEKSFYYTSISYGIGVSLLTLAIPISVQSLINSITVGVLIQPLIVISIALFSLLVFSSVLSALQVYTIEIFQRYFYARISLKISNRFLNADNDYFKTKDPKKLMNKYFEIMTVQKTMIKTLAEGVTLVLQTLVGLILLSFYHPYFLVFDLVLVFLLVLVWKMFALGAFKSSVNESNAKYETVEWFQDMAADLSFFQQQEEKKTAETKSREHINNYLVKRSKHFKKVYIQTILLYIIYAVMSALVLGLGGYLVIKGQLTVGQLVAAEIIVGSILYNMSKGGKFLEALYDLYAGVKKLEKFFKIKKQVNSSQKSKSI